MPITTKVRFAHEDGALADTLAALPDLHVTVVPEASTDPTSNVYLFRFETDVPTDIESALADDHTVERVEPIAVFEAENTLAIEFSSAATLLAPQVTNHGGFVLKAQSATAGSTPRGWYERWSLPDRDSLHDIWQYALSAGFDFEIIDFHEQGATDPDHPVPSTYTPEQREALVTAYEMGYFTEPRETSLEEIAAELGISPTAVAGRLKRGMRSLVGTTVVVDRQLDRHQE
jgi:predicted DNA binding protein